MFTLKTSRIGPNPVARFGDGMPAAAVAAAAAAVCLFSAARKEEGRRDVRHIKRREKSQWAVRMTFFEIHRQRIR